MSNASIAIIDVLFLHEVFLLVQLRCSCAGHVTLSCDSVAKRTRIPVASPD